MTFRERLNELKANPCVRLNFSVSDTFRLELFKHYKKYFPLLFNDIDQINFDLPKGWVTHCTEGFRKLEDAGAKVRQIKQKFGELRIYVDYPLIGIGDSETIINFRKQQVDTILEEISDKAAQTCEFCGSQQGVSLWEIGYVARMCMNCKRDLAEYHILSWALEDNRGLDAPGVIVALNYSREVLKQFENGKIEINHKGLYETQLARIAGQNNTLAKQ